MLVDATPATEYYCIRYSPNDEWEGCGFPQPPNNDELQEFTSHMQRLRRDHYTYNVARLVRLDK